MLKSDLINDFRLHQKINFMQIGNIHISIINHQEAGFQEHKRGIHNNHTILQANYENQLVLSMKTRFCSKPQLLIS